MAGIKAAEEILKWVLVEILCSVETSIQTNCMNVSRFAIMILHEILLINRENTGFQVSPEPSFQDRKFGFDQEPVTIPDKVKIVGHLLSIFPPDIRGTFDGSELE